MTSTHNYFFQKFKRLRMTTVFNKRLATWGLEKTKTEVIFFFHIYFAKHISLFAKYISSPNYVSVIRSTNHCDRSTPVLLKREVRTSALYGDMREPLWGCEQVSPHKIYLTSNSLFTLFEHWTKWSLSRSRSYSSRTQPNRVRNEWLANLIRVL